MAFVTNLYFFMIKNMVNFSRGACEHQLTNYRKRELGMKTVKKTVA